MLNRLLENKSGVNFKQRLNFGLIGCGLFLLVAYFLAFQPTLKIYKAQKRSAKKYVNADNLPQQVQQLSQELALLKSRINYSDEAQQLQQLAVLSAYCESNAIAFNYTQPEIIQNEEDKALLTSHTNIELAGEYKKILQCLYLIEEKEHMGEVIHVNFFKDEKSRTNPDQLRAAVIVEQLIREK